MKEWSFYRKDSGIFTGQIFSSSDPEMLKANTPHGCSAIEGRHDHLSKRVNLETGEVADWQSPPPDEDHEWIDGRWTLKASVLAKQETVRKIQALEVKKIRAMGELLLDTGNEAAKNRLSLLDAQIEDLRNQLRGNAVG